jgi:translation initiation factor IF-3
LRPNGFDRNRGREDNRQGFIINERIRHHNVRVTTPDGINRVLDVRDALYIARQNGLDLVLIQENANPPVCKIIDYNKFLYEVKQKEKEAKKKQRESIVEQKEIRMGLNIERGDIETKVTNIRKMLEKKCKVTLTVTLRGRERGKSELAVELLNKFAQLLQVELEGLANNGGRVSAKIK